MLLEVLVAMALMVLALLPLGGAFVASLASIKAAGDHLVAAALAQQAADRARSEAAADFAAFAASGTSATAAGGFQVCRRVTDAPGGWTGTVRVEIAVARTPCPQVWSGQAAPADVPARLELLLAPGGI